MKRRAVPLAAAVAVVALVVAVGVGWRASRRPGGPRTVAGEVTAPTSLDDTPGTASTFQVPEAIWTVEVSDPFDEFEGRNADDDFPLATHAPDGLDYVVVRAQKTPVLGDASIMKADDDAVTLSLLVDGEPSTLRSPGDVAPMTWYVTVPTGAPLGLSLDFDGRDQVVEAALRPSDVQNAPALLAEPTLHNGTNCPDSWHDGALDSSAVCTVLATRVPYREELGWSKDGQDWVIVESSWESADTAYWDGEGGRSVSYDATVGDLTGRLGGVDLDDPGVLDSDTSEHPVDQVLAFAVPDDARGRLVLRRSVDARARSVARARALGAPTAWRGQQTVSMVLS
ncbi:hypothetical protein [Nocardioides acrostichi]|uniref:Uncharacterized protein n=1 Tax=Nocardioides acrostichi TaxID=2784339 RepID=A0A930UXZ7_9ACTN|nr:hypothetical protein [Nocardioides acrostichi]MBF4160157.1 hypothetical protein [Nocardioides acrostichi]